MHCYSVALNKRLISATVHAGLLQTADPKISTHWPISRCTKITKLLIDLCFYQNLMFSVALDGAV